MVDLWTNLTAGQGAFLSGAFTAFGAVVAVLIAQKFFGDRVSGLQDAVGKTEESVEEFEQKFEQKLTTLSENLDRTFSSLQSSLAKTQAAVYENQSSDGDAAEENGLEKNKGTRDRVIESWHKIRDRIEELASSPNVDGRTRAKYSRLDRRSYYDLASALAYDGFLPDLETAENAINLWYSCRRKDDVAENCAVQMEDYWDAIKEWPIP